MSLNDFEIGKILGKGAFATVAIVTRKEDRKTYAMKRINISKLDAKEKESALNEIRILASLTHPNIIGYKEAFFDENSKTLNIVMEYADDGDIDKKIKDNLRKRNLFSEETIWSWIIQILEGLKYLHDNKIMHRDLKCANIFLMKDGILKLGDLNVSKIAKLGMAQTQTGTPYYISPEIWKEQPYDYKCDIWSVGCIIYEICTLRPPFRGNSLKELYTNIMNGYYLPISNCYSNDLKDIISMMLVIDNKKRASTDQLLNSNLVKKWINIIRGEKNSKLGNELINNYTNNIKANLIKTIKMPKNLKDINNQLPKKRYNPSQEMMKNDKYEIMKETMKRENNYRKKEMDLSWLNGFNNDNVYNNNYQKNNNERNMNNNNRNVTPNKYSYLNKYDANMRLKNNEKMNNNIRNLNNINKNNYYFDNNVNRENQYKKEYNINYNFNNINYNDRNYNDRNYNNNYNNRNNINDYNNYNNYNNQNRNNNYRNNNINPYYYQNEKMNYNNEINYNYRRNYENNNYNNNNRGNNYCYNNQNEYGSRNYKYEEDIQNNNKYNNDYNKGYNYDNNYENKKLTPYRYQNSPYLKKQDNRTPNKYQNSPHFKRQDNRTPNRRNDQYQNNYFREENNIDNKNYQNRPVSQIEGKYQENYYQQNKYSDINRNNNPKISKNENNYSNRKGNRYKFMFVDDGENNYSENNNYINNNQYYNHNSVENYYQNNNNYQYNKYQNENKNNNYNRNINNIDYNRRDIGPRYNLYDFRYNNDNNYNNNQQQSDEIKITFQKINYDDYCEKNKFDRKRNYHFYRENGYYNYNKAIKNFKNINNHNNNNRYYYN